MYERILVPTDGSTEAEAAARHGVNLATVFDSQLHFLSVVEDESYNGALSDINSGGGEQEETGERPATEAVEKLEDSMAESSMTCHTAVDHGIPHEVILSYVAEHEINLISMGTHGRTGLNRMLMGSVTERVIRTSDVPVLASQSRPADRAGYDRILIPTDGSEAAATAATHGIAIAERYDATVHAISVVDTNRLLVPYPMRRSDVRTALQEECEQAVEGIRERCESHGHDLDVVTDVMEGTPHQVIQNYIGEEAIELVAMGTQGRTGLERHLIGSVAERVIRTSDVPVLTTQ